MKLPLLLAAAVALGGCAAMRSLDSDVSTYSRWPAERKPATYAFERLPSQQERPEQQQRLEAAARGAVEAAGFAAAADPKSADVTVQVGARITATVARRTTIRSGGDRACGGRSSTAAAGACSFHPAGIRTAGIHTAGIRTAGARAGTATNARSRC